MQQDAIQRIEALAQASQWLPDTDMPTVVLPEGCKTESLEKYLDQPRRMRRTFKTERIPDFCRYVDGNAQESNTVVFVRPDGGAATAVIDYGTHEAPLWGEHRAELVMQHTPEYAALLQLATKPQGQREITDWLEDWRDIIHPYRFDDAGEDSQPLSVAQAIHGIRRIDLTATGEKTVEESDWKARRTSLEQIEARSGNAKLPSGFGFVCRVYPETHDRKIDVRLSIRTSREDPVLVARVVGRAALEQEVAEEVELDLTSRLSRQRVFIGQL